MSYRTLVKGTQVLLVVALGAFLLAACSGVKLATPAESDAAKSMETPSDKALIYVYRPSGWGRQNRLGVSINGATVGETAGQTFFLIQVSPGPVKVASQGMNPAAVTFDAQAGARYYLEQGIHPGVFRPSTSIKVVGENEGKAGVERLKLVRFVKL